MLRQTLIFSGLIVAGVAGLTLSGGEDHTLAKLAGWAVSSATPDSTPYVGVAKSAPATLARQVTLNASDSGHFVGEFRLNGQRVTAMVDTGATVIAMDRTTARRIGIKLASSDFQQPVQTANGMTKAAAAVLNRVQIGRIDVENVEAMVLDDRSFDGVLVGMSFLRRLQRFEARNNRLLLVQ